MSEIEKAVKADYLNAEIARLQAENQRLRDESDEWERKSKNNGLAAMLGLERLQMLEPKIYQLQDDRARLRAALEVYATPENWYGLLITNTEPWLTAQTALGLIEP